MSRTTETAAIWYCLGFRAVTQWSETLSRETFAVRLADWLAPSPFGSVSTDVCTAVFDELEKMRIEFDKST